MTAYAEFPGDSEILMKLRNGYRKRGVNEVLVNENASQKLKFRKALFTKFKGKVLATLVKITLLPVCF